MTAFGFAQPVGHALGTLRYNITLVLSGHSLPNFKRWTRWPLGHNFRPLECVAFNQRLLMNWVNPAIHETLNRRTLACGIRWA
jgi:hypothetical protein